MNFSKLRHKIVFLKPKTVKSNGQSESVIGFVPFHPSSHTEVSGAYATHDGEMCYDEEIINGRDDVYKICSVRAFVSPTTGREYEEAQKLRAETTYNVVTRYFKGIEENMKILYNDKVFDIISVLDIGEEHREMKIICKEKDRYGKEEVYYD